MILISTPNGGRLTFDILDNFLFISEASEYSSSTVWRASQWIRGRSLVQVLEWSEGCSGVTEKTPASICVLSPFACQMSLIIDIVKGGSGISFTSYRTASIAVWSSTAAHSRFNVGFCRSTALFKNEFIDIATKLWAMFADPESRCRPAVEAYCDPGKGGR